MTLFLRTFFILCFVSSQSFAACYTPDQYRAEQAIRFHTQLMVIGMLCQKPYKQNAYGEYESFTKRNGAVIKAEENRLLAYFRSVKKPSPDRALYSFRTDMANAYSIQAMGASGVFCRTMVTRYKQAKAMKANDFQAWIKGLDPQKLPTSTQPLCAAARQRP